MNIVNDSENNKMISAYKITMSTLPTKSTLYHAHVIHFFWWTKDKDLVLVEGKAIG